MPDIEFRLTATDEATPVIERARAKLDQFNRSYSAPMGGGKGQNGELPAYQPNYNSKIDSIIGDFFGSFQKLLPGGMKGAMPDATGAGPMAGSTEGAAAKGAAGGAMAGVAIMALVGAVKSGMNKLTEFAQKTWQIMVEATPQLKGTLQWIYDVLALSLYPLGQSINTMLIPIAEKITDLSTELLVKFGDINIDNPEEIKEYIVEVVEKYADLAAELIVELAPPVILALLEAGVRASLELFGDFGTWLWESLTGKISEGWGVLTGLGGWIWDGITGFIGENFPELAGIGTWVSTGIKGLISSGWSTLSGIGSWLYNSINSALVGIGGESYKAFHNAIASMLNSIANIELPLVGKPFKGLFGTIPMLASGGIVTSPTLAMIGEKGPEAVVPLNKSGGFGQGVTVNINAPIYGVSDLESAIDNAIRRSQMGYATYR